MEIEVRGVEGGRSPKENQERKETVIRHWVISVFLKNSAPSRPYCGYLVNILENKMVKFD